MKVFVNGEEREVEAGVKLTDLLGGLGLAEERIAVELNKSVVRRRDWEATEVSAGDKIEVVHFVGGG